MKTGIRLIPGEVTYGLNGSNNETYATSRYTLVYGIETLAVFSATGMSKPRNGDEFNELTGMRVAQSKMHRNALGKAIKWLKRYEAEAVHRANELHAKVAQLTTAEDNEDFHLSQF